MKIEVLFFASLREALGVGSCDVALEEGASVKDLIAHLVVSDENWKKALEDKLLCSVNQEMMPLDTLLKEGDEVGLFPPVTGG